MSGEFHGKSIQEIVEIRWKQYEMRLANERREKEERERLLKEKLAENKKDVTQPAPAQDALHHLEPLKQVKKWLHDHHLF